MQTLLVDLILAAAVGRLQCCIGIMWRVFPARRVEKQQWLIFLLCSGAGLTIGRRIGRGAAYKRGYAS